MTDFNQNYFLFLFGKFKWVYFFFYIKYVQGDVFHGKDEGVMMVCSEPSEPNLQARKQNEIDMNTIISLSVFHS